METSAVSAQQGALLRRVGQGEDLENFQTVGASSAEALRTEQAGCIKGTGRRLVWQEVSLEKQGLVHGEHHGEYEFDGSHWRVLNGRVSNLNMFLKDHTSSFPFCVHYLGTVKRVLIRV